jgi:hypothetical protein
MLRRVALVRTDVSEERSVSIISATEMGEPGTTLAVTSNRRTLRRNRCSQIARYLPPWWCGRNVPPKRRFLREPQGVNFPANDILHSHSRENLKSNSVAFSPQANYTDWGTAACRRSYCQLSRVGRCQVVSATGPHGSLSRFSSSSSIIFTTLSAPRPRSIISK